MLPDTGEAPLRTGLPGKDSKERTRGRQRVLQPHPWPACASTPRALSCQLSCPVPAALTMRLAIAR